MKAPIQINKQKSVSKKKIHLFTIAKYRKIQFVSILSIAIGEFDLIYFFSVSVNNSFD